MQMYCKGCMEFMVIGKYSPDTWGFDSGVGEAMNLFVEKHYDCTRRIAGFDDMDGGGWFGYRTENDEDKDGLYTYYTPVGGYLSIHRPPPPPPWNER